MSELTCDHCGDVAIAAPTTNGFFDGDGERCAACGMPGHVVVEEDEDEAYWSDDQEAGVYCQREDCDECAERRREEAKDAADAKPIVCVHGSLARACETCDLIADRDEWKARAVKHGRQVDELVTQVCQLVEREEANIARATQAEAQVAAMREMLNSLVETYECQHVPTTWSPKHRAVLRGDAGRSLLAEVEALREVQAATLEARGLATEGPDWARVDAALVKYEAAVDATRKGET